MPDSSLVVFDTNVLVSLLVKNRDLSTGFKCFQHPSKTAYRKHSEKLFNIEWSKLCNLAVIIEEGGVNAGVTNLVLEELYNLAEKRVRDKNYFDDWLSNYTLTGLEVKDSDFSLDYGQHLLKVINSVIPKPNLNKAWDYESLLCYHELNVKTDLSNIIACIKYGVPKVVTNDKLLQKVELFNVAKKYFNQHNPKLRGKFEVLSLDQFLACQKNYNQAVL